MLGTLQASILIFGSRYVMDLGSMPASCGPSGRCCVDSLERDDVEQGPAALQGLHWAHRGR